MRSKVLRFTSAFAAFRKRRISVFLCLLLIESIPGGGGGISNSLRTSCSISFQRSTGGADVAAAMASRSSASALPRPPLHCRIGRGHLQRADRSAERAAALRTVDGARRMAASRTNRISSSPGCPSERAS